MSNIPSEDLLPENEFRLEGEEWRFIGTNYIKNCDETYMVSSYGRVYNYKERRFMSPNPTSTASFPPSARLSAVQRRMLWGSAFWISIRSSNSPW